VSAFKKIFDGKYRKRHTSEPLFQSMPSDLSLQAEQMCSTGPSQQSQLHTHANAFPSVPEYNENWNKVSYKQSRSSPNNNNVTKTKHS
jgi:hypothetical protein